MQSLQAMSKVPSQSSNLPPLHNLPSWTRNSLVRKKQPRQIIRDRLQPIKQIGEAEEMDERGHEKSNGKSCGSGRVVSALLQGQGLDQEQRIDHVEKTIDYLRMQHAETLSNLHKEIEQLKAENKGEAIEWSYHPYIFKISFLIIVLDVKNFFSDETSCPVAYSRLIRLFRQKISKRIILPVLNYSAC